MFFSWWTGIFVACSAIVLFIAWSRCLTAKDVATTEQQKSLWAVFRVLILIGLMYEVALFIVGIVDLPRVFSYMTAIFLTYLAVVFLWGVTFFVSVIKGKSAARAGGGQKGAAGRGGHNPGPAQLKKVTQQMHKNLSVILGMAESLRDHGTESDEDLKDVASSIVTSAKQLDGLIDQVRPE